MKHKKKRTRHNYTSELELNSLLIREKNTKLKKEFSQKYNSTINRYIKIFTKLNRKKYEKGSKKYYQKNKLKVKLKERIIKLSEVTCIGTTSHERFGEIILLMIKHILTKPNFSGYTYTTDFYSDAIYKVLTYLHNFDHTLISKRTNIRVNAFAYISQIIHNSIVFIIKKKQNERIKVNHLITSEISDKNLNIINHKRDPNLSVVGDNYGFEKRIDEEFFIDAEPNLLENIKHISKQIGKKKIAYVYYPTDYKISLEEYYQMKPLLKYINVTSMKNYDLSKLKDPIDVLKNKSQNAKL